jgi:hypothetical protein
MFTMIAVLALAGQVPAAASDGAKPAAKASAGAKRLAIPGTHLSVLPQPDFREAAGFTGLESVKHEASLMFIELPAPRGGDPVQELNKSLTPERLRTRGFTLKSKETGKQDGRSTVLIKGEVLKDGDTYIQWILFTFTSEPTAFQVLATAPADEFRRIEKSFKLMLDSVRWEKQLAATTGGRYYTLVLPAGWKLAKQLGPLDLYTESGRFPIPSGESSLAVENLNEKSTDFRAFVKAQNLKRNHYTDLKELESTFLKLDGLDANISYVSALEVEDRKLVILQYCYIHGEETTFLIEGNRTGKLSKETFEKVAKSWKLKEEDDDRNPKP